MQKRGEGGTTVRACLPSKALPTSRSLRPPLLCIRARNSSASLPNRFARVFLLSVTSAPLWLIFLVHSEPLPTFRFLRLHFQASLAVRAWLQTTMLRLQTLRAEMRPTLRLALPLVLAEIGWMTMGIVDTVMVGHLPDSAGAIGAVSISSSIFNVVAFFGGGLLIGLDTLVAQAFGAGQREDCHRSLVNGIYLSLVMTPFLMAPVWFFAPLLQSLASEPAVANFAVPYMKALAFGLFPLLLYFAVRRCLQAMNLVKPVAFALVTSNLINLLFNWTLIYGKLGA